MKDTVGQAIIEGLTAVVRSNPEDAVDYLGRFLLHYADHLEGQQKVCIEDSHLESPMNEEPMALLANSHASSIAIV